MVAEDVGERADAEVAGVLLVDVPGVALELVDGGDDCGVVAPGEAGPGVEDLVGGEVGVPGEPAEAVEVGHGHGVMHPVGVEADVGDADEAAEWLVEGFAFDDLFDGRAAVLLRGGRCRAWSSTWGRGRPCGAAGRGTPA